MNWDDADDVPSQTLNRILWWDAKGYDVIPGAGGIRKLRWAAKGKGKRGGARIIYVYVVVHARLYLLRCYAKNSKVDLTAGEKRELRQLAAYLKGAQ